VAWNQETFDATGEVSLSWDDKAMRIDLTRDVSNIRGKVGDMVKTVRRFTCYPVLSLTVSHTIF
ncbi:MAG: hypothetical protein II505_02560, partial [Bacteroidaceae bacterium]|nr:hypothetical protein [Bacteroidaceae bacterium]